MGGLASSAADFNRGIFGDTFNPSDPMDLWGTTGKYNRDKEQASVDAEYDKYKEEALRRNKETEVEGSSPIKI